MGDNISSQDGTHTLQGVVPVRNIYLGVKAGSSTVIQGSTKTYYGYWIAGHSPTKPICQVLDPTQQVGRIPGQKRHILIRIYFLLLQFI